MQCNSMQYNTVQYNATRYITIGYSIAEYSTPYRVHLIPPVPLLIPPVTLLIPPAPLHAPKDPHSIRDLELENVDFVSPRSESTPKSTPRCKLGTFCCCVLFILHTV
jgi:hypothetical protein